MFVPAVILVPKMPLPVQPCLSPTPSQTRLTMFGFGLDVINELQVVPKGGGVAVLTRLPLFHPTLACLCRSTAV
jgi:hypothetical protein